MTSVEAVRKVDKITKTVSDSHSPRVPGPPILMTPQRHYTITHYSTPKIYNSGSVARKAISMQGH